MSSNSSQSTIGNFYWGLLKQKLQEDESISIKIFKAFTLFGISSAWIFGGKTIQDTEHGLYGPASIVVWSYTTSFISLGCILLLQFMMNPNKQNIDVLKNISGVFTIILMIWIITINLKHFKNINMNLVPDSYYEYSSWTYLLLLVQSIFTYVTMPSSKDGTNDEVAKKRITQISMLNVVLVFLSFVLVMIQQIILDNFSVDVL